MEIAHSSTPAQEEPFHFLIRGFLQGYQGLLMTKITVSQVLLTNLPHWKQFPNL